jgi:hypothetical protein
MEYANIHRRNELFTDKLRNVKIIRSVDQEMRDNSFRFQVKKELLNHL